MLSGAVACRPAGATQHDDSPSGAHATVHDKIADRAFSAQVPDADNAGDWPMAGRDYANTRYSPLERINRANVSGLALAWQFTTGVERGHEAAPLVIGGTMYVVSPFPDKVFAFDLSRPGAPPKWTYDPRPDPAAQGVACCDVVSRGLAYADGKVFLNVLDDRTIALDADTGRVAWSTSLGDISRGETITMAPLVVRRHVLVGNSGGEFGVRGWLTALDVDTGAVAWRAYSTGPDSDVLIGPSFAPFYGADRGKDLGLTTWPPEKWKNGGGTVWGFLSYDPDLELLFYGTSNPGPWNAEQRPGDNKWTASLFARSPETGEAKWAYQYSPHDLYDYDGVNEAVLVDLEMSGTRRKALLHPDRNGFMYVIDRTTGEVLSAEPFVRTTTVSDIDLRSGRPRYVREKQPRLGSVVRDICPAAPGGKDWQPSAFSNKTGWLYVPHNNLCSEVEGTEANYIAGTPYVGANVRMVIGEGGHGGAFSAWDPVRAHKAWSIPEDFPVWSGALATAGDVVFYGTMDGYFKAVDAVTGKVLWTYKAASGIIGQPITYLGPDGVQYVAIFSGVGGWSGVLVPARLDPADPTAGNGFANAMKALKSRTKPGGALLVFALKEKA